MAAWVDTIYWFDTPPAVTDTTSAAGDLKTSSYLPRATQVFEFGANVTIAIVVGFTNFVLRLSTLSNSGTNTGRRDLTLSVARSAGDYEYVNLRTEGTDSSAYDIINVGQRVRLRANTAAAGGNTGTIQANLVMFPMPKADLSTMTRTASTAV